MNKVRSGSMSKQRIYEYAKSLNIKSKDVIDELKKSGVEVSNHMQTLENDHVKTLDKAFKKDNTSKEQSSSKKNQTPQGGQKKEQPKQIIKSNTILLKITVMPNIIRIISVIIKIISKTVIKNKNKQHLHQNQRKCHLKLRILKVSQLVN